MYKEANISQNNAFFSYLILGPIVIELHRAIYRNLKQMFFWFYYFAFTHNYLTIEVDSLMSVQFVQLIFETKKKEI